MDTAVLVDADLEFGRQALEVLDESKIAVSAAFWLRTEDSDEWRLVLAMDMVRKQGPLATYKAVQSVLRRRHVGPELPLMRISLVEPKHPLVRALSSAFQTKGKKPSSIELDHCVINGVLIHGAYIYRTAPIRRRRTK